MAVHVMAEGAIASRRPVPMRPKSVRCCGGTSRWGCGKSLTIDESTSGKSLDRWAEQSLAMDMVLENSTEVRRVNTYEQVESGRGYRK
jgi:hypothetical protein